MVSNINQFFLHIVNHLSFFSFFRDLLYQTVVVRILVDVWKLVINIFISLIYKQNVKYLINNHQITFLFNLIFFQGLILAFETVQMSAIVRILASLFANILKIQGNFRMKK